MFQIEVRLYTYHDLDLVSIYHTGQIDFPAVTLQILNAYARKEAYRVCLQEPNQKKIAKYASAPDKRFYHYYVDLYEDTDGDAVQLLSRITPGYRNNFIKSLLRQYLCGVFTPAYSTDGDTALFDEMSELFQAGRQSVSVDSGSEHIPKIGEEKKRLPGEEDAPRREHKESEKKKKDTSKPDAVPKKEPTETHTESRGDNFESFLNQATERLIFSE